MVLNSPDVRLEPPEDFCGKSCHFFVWKYWLWSISFKAWDKKRLFQDVFFAVTWLSLEGFPLGSSPSQEPLHFLSKSSLTEDFDCLLDERWDIGKGVKGAAFAKEKACFPTFGPLNPARFPLKSMIFRGRWWSRLLNKTHFFFSKKFLRQTRMRVKASGKQH